ncbi:hypothetical protein IQ241_18630 [Romeria aff. gracilis LEGE 07310]|uniref:Uncharacterized protein n=1 Tax=Vasconcelosia minhoensis LEGE 07310 TaxID=915328 RepID=A0A8J7AHM5_9CYAN|nr:hypothetical protein [Romeria gracilis]MBE9079286.1 hypothetical protein [Romeria aff. gracilis LEGE 07310]
MAYELEVIPAEFSYTLNLGWLRLSCRISLLHNRRQIHGGQRLLDKIIDAIPLIQSLKYRAMVNIAIAKQFNLDQAPEQALPFIEEAIRELSTLPSEESAFWEYDIAKQLAKMGLQSRSEDILAKLFHQANQEEDPDGRDLELAVVAATYAEIGLFDQAIEVACMIMDDFHKVWRAFDSIVHTAALNSEHEQISKVLAAVDYEGSRDYLMAEAASSYALANQPERAIRFVQQITSPGEKVNALQTPFQSLLKRGAELNKLQTLLNYVEGYALVEQDLNMKAQALRIVAEQYTELDQFDNARELLNQAQQLVSALRADDFLTQTSLDEIADGIARASVKLDRREQILQTAEPFTEQNLKNLALSYAIVIEDKSLTFKSRNLEEVCKRVEKLNDLDAGLEFLRQALEQLPTFDTAEIESPPASDIAGSYRDAHKGHALAHIVGAYFALLRNVT